MTFKNLSETGTDLSRTDVQERSEERVRPEMMLTALLTKEGHCVTVGDTCSRALVNRVSNANECKQSLPAWWK